LVFVCLPGRNYKIHQIIIPSNQPLLKLHSYHASIVSCTIWHGPSPCGILRENICLICYVSEYATPDNNGSNMYNMNEFSVMFIHIQGHFHHGQWKIDWISTRVFIFVWFTVQKMYWWPPPPKRT
jgi:hypothetical protein